MNKIKRQVGSIKISSQADRGPTSLRFLCTRQCSRTDIETTWHQKGVTIWRIFSSLSDDEVHSSVHVEADRLFTERLCEAARLEVKS